MNKLYFYFVLSHVCNLSCAYCYVPKYNKYEAKAYGENAISASKEFIEKAKIEGLSLGQCTFHGAETSILSPVALGECINLFYEATHNVVKCQSNGINFTKSYLEELLTIIKEPRKFRIGFSIDGCEEAHDVNRKGTYRLVIQNLKDAISLGFSVSILCVVTKSVVKHLDKLEAFCSFLDSINAIYAFKSAAHGYEINDTETEAFAQWALDNKRYDHVQACMSTICSTRGNHCEFYEFDMNGNVYACNKTFSKEGVFSNWKEETFTEIIQKRRSLFQSVDIDALCYVCPIFIKCQGGCPADRVNAKNLECKLKRIIHKELLDESLNIR